MTAPNGGRRGRETPYILSQLQAASIQSGGSGELVIPQNFGGTGKGKISDSSAINLAIEYCESVQGAAVWMRGQFLAREPIEFKDGVYLFGERFGRTLLGNSGATLFTDDTSLDFLVDFPELVQGGGIVGLNIRGPGQALTSAIGGVRVNNQANNIKLQGLWIGEFSDSCIQSAATPSDSPTSVTIDDVVLATDSTGRTLTEPCGSLHITGTDHYVRAAQCNGGPSSPLGAGGDENVMYPGQFFRCGVYLNCITSWFWDMNGEFGDVGIYLDDLCQGNRFIGPRADVNAGHGWYVRGSNNQMVGCSAMLNGATAFFGGPTVTYDGVIHVGPAEGNKWTNYQYLPVAPIPTVRYAWNDTVANDYAHANTVDTIMCNEVDVIADIHHAVAPFSALVKPGAGPVTSRPPSRRAHGSTWTDTTAKVSNFSDGTNWRDDFGPVGNLCTPALAKGVGGAMQLAAFDAKCTVTGEFWAFTTTNGKKLGTPVLVAAVCTSAGATAGSFFVSTLAPDTAVTPGTTYSVGIRSIAETQPATVTLVAQWLDSGGAGLSITGPYTAAVGGTNSTSVVTDSVFHGVVAPAGAAFLRCYYGFARVGLTAGETHRMNGVSIVPDTAGLTTGYIEP